MTKSITVSNREQLINALGNATGGETILLNPGNYGDLSLRDKASFNLDYNSPVTIAAANPDKPPVVTGLDLRGATDLHFENITFDYSHKAGEPIWEKPFKVWNSENISFTGCTFDGDVARGLTAVDNGFPTGFGLHVVNTNGFTLQDSEFLKFYKGINITNSNDVVVTGNDVHSMRMDAMNFAAVKDVLIEDNHIHSFLRSMASEDHADMIQFWTAGTDTPSANIVIRNNILDIGTGQFTQSIFMRNDLVDTGAAGSEMFYRNVTIEGNTIVNGHLHGINVGATAGLTITRNTVLHDDGGNPDGADTSVEIPRIAVASNSTNVAITHNATSGIVGHTDQAGWTVKMNAFVQDQDPLGPGWYGDTFISSTLTSPDGAKAIRIHPEGILSTLGAGAPQLMPVKPTTVDAVFHSSAETAGGRTAMFDASFSTGPQVAGASYVWDFGDGHKGTGMQVTHRYADGGVYEAQLTVTLPNGTKDTAAARVTINDTELISLQDNGTFLASTAGTDTVLTTISNLDADDGIQLGGSGHSATLARTYLNPMLASKDVTISLQLDADAKDATGEIMRLHNSFIVSVNSKGEAVVRAWSSAGEAVTLTSTGVRVNDGKNYDVDIRLEEGRLSLWVDDLMVRDADFSGNFANAGRHDLTFGNPWGKNTFNGDVTEFAININDGHFDPFTMHAIDTGALLI